MNRPLVSKLESTLKLAKQHLNKNSDKHALKFIEKFITEVNNKNNQKYISTSAKLNLTHHTQLLMDSIKNKQRSTEKQPPF